MLPLAAILQERDPGTYVSMPGYSTIQVLRAAAELAAQKDSLIYVTHMGVVVEVAWDSNAALQERDVERGRDGCLGPPGTRVSAYPRRTLTDEDLASDAAIREAAKRLKDLQDAVLRRSSGES